MGRFRERRIERLRQARGPRTPWWRWLITAALGCGVVVAIVFYFEKTSTGGGAALFRVTTETVTLDEPPGQRAREGRQILALSPADEALNERQRELVRSLARRHVGMPLQGGELADLRILQRLVDQGVLAPSDTYELQALGVVLGDVFAHQLNLSWVVIRDQYGRSRALQIPNSEDLIFPVTMISKRVEAGLPVDVERVYADVVNALER